MDAKNVFSRNLGRQMEVSKRTRQDISTALGVSYFTVTSWVNGSKYPRMDKVEKLAQYLGCTKSDLVEEKKEQPTEIDGLSEKRKALMQFAMSVPEDKAEMILQVMKTILEND